LKLGDIILTATRSLKEQRFRLALNVLGILIGCAAVTGLISITQGLTVEVGDQLQLFGPNNLMVVPFEIRAGRGLVGQGMTWREVQIVEKVAHVKYVSPIVGSKAATYTYKGEKYTASAFGVDPIYFQIFKAYEMAQGRGLIQSDSGAAVIGYLVSHPRDQEKAIYDLGDRIKLTFRIGGEEQEFTFRIVGIMKEVGGTFGSEDDNSLLIPYREAQQIFQSGSKVDYVALTVDSSQYVKQVIEDIKDRFSDNVMIMDYEMIQQQVDQILGTIEAVLGGIAAISLLVAGVGIVNTMTISVMERTREIGVLKAIGGKNRDILALFLTEATITGVIGGAMGAAFGFLLGTLVGNYIGLPVSTSPFLGLSVVGFAMITSVLAGLYPAWRASGLNPVEALRYE
jgi:putative ABC transport system permease protein